MHLFKNSTPDRVDRYFRRGHWSPPLSYSLARHQRRPENHGESSISFDLDRFSDIHAPLFPYGHPFLLCRHGWERFLAAGGIVKQWAKSG